MPRRLTALVLLVLALASAAFYWYDLRPSRTRVLCGNLVSFPSGLHNTHEPFSESWFLAKTLDYELCMHRRGF